MAYQPLSHVKKEEAIDSGHEFKGIWEVVTGAVDMLRRRVLYHPCDGSHHDNRNNAPPCFYILHPCLQTDQRLLDCLADGGCGVHNDDYGSRGLHPFSTCPCNGLTKEEIDAVRSNNGPPCGCRLSHQEKYFAHNARKLLFDDPADEFIVDAQELARSVSNLSFKSVALISS
jgi:hypothetical protein